MKGGRSDSLALDGLQNRRFGVFIRDNGQAGALSNLEYKVGRRFDVLLAFHDWAGGLTGIPVVPPRVLAEVGGRDYVMTLQPSTGSYGRKGRSVVSWQRLIRGDYDRQIADLGRWIDATHNNDFFVRFAHEMNGRGWYDWQVGGACGVYSPENYAAGFNHLAKILHENSQFAKVVWSPNNQPVDAIHRFYPTECDILGFDAYNFGTTEDNWQSDEQVYGPAYDAVAECDPDKEIWICETACAEPAAPWFNGHKEYPADPRLSKAAWVRAMFEHSARYARVTTTIWFNQPNQRDWVMTSSPGTTLEFYQAFADSRRGALRTAT